MPNYASFLLLLLLPAFAAAQTASENTPDPNCARGLAVRGACCPAACGQCGGAGCGERGATLRSNCCPGSILSNAARICDNIGPPCRLTNATRADPLCTRGLPRAGACCRSECRICGQQDCGVRGREAGTPCCPGQIKRAGRLCSLFEAPCTLSVAVPTPLPSPSPPSATQGRWKIEAVTSGLPVARHEACALMVNGLVVLLGGRGVNKAVSIYNPITATWSNRRGPGPGIELHHMQCVHFAGSVYVVSSWKGPFPFEENNDKIYVYNVSADQWSTRAGMPPWRQRGGAAAVIRGSIIYVVGGNRGGHGGHARALGYVDAYDIENDTWMTRLPRLPSPRDHTGGALVGGRLCVAGGRDGGSPDFFRKNIASTWCYSFRDRVWDRVGDMPAPRAGANTGRVCDGSMVVAGGEGDGVAYRRVDVFDGNRWKRAPDLVSARHGSGLAVAQCACGAVFVPSGSGRQGGSPELTTTERWVPDGSSTTCAKY